MKVPKKKKTKDKQKNKNKKSTNGADMKRYIILD
jgi:hypothetical protein